MRISSVAVVMSLAGCSVLVPLDEYGAGTGGSTSTSSSSASSAGGAGGSGTGGGAGGNATGGGEGGSVSACGNVLTNPDHCGACGHDCGPTASCAGGLCGVEDFMAELDTFFTGLLYQPGEASTRLLLAAQFDGSGGDGPGYVASVDVTGNTWTLQEKGWLPTPARALALDTTYAYVAAVGSMYYILNDNLDGTPIAVGAPPPPAGHARLSVRDGQVALASEAADTVALRFGATATHPADLPFDVLLAPGPVMYWTDRAAGGGVFRDGDPPVSVDAEGGATGLAFAAPHVFWANCSTGMLHRLHTTDTSVEPLHAGLGHPWLVVVDDAEAFVFDLGIDLCAAPYDDVRLALTQTPTGKLWRVRSDGTGTPLLLADGLALAGGLAVAGDYLYWVEARNTTEARARLRRVAR